MSEYITMQDCLRLDLKDAIAQRDNLQDQRDFAISEMERLKRERNRWRADCLEQCKFLAMSADREEKLRDALEYIAGLDTSQAACAELCSAVAVAMEVLDK